LYRGLGHVAYSDKHTSREEGRREFGAHGGGEEGSNILSRKPEEKIALEDLMVDRRTVLKWDL
jgi:hypothetical protein